MTWAPARTTALPLAPTVLSGVYALFGLTLGLTAVGVFLGAAFAPLLYRTGVYLLLTLVELGIIFTSTRWVDKQGWNVLFFGLFPLLSGVTVAPYLFLVAASPMGNVILLHALLATTLMVLAGALVARRFPQAVAGLGGVLSLSLLGLLLLMVLQIFIPALRLSTGFELALSGGGVVLFAVFTTYDLARLRQMAGAGMSPLLLALHLYLDIFNLFLMVLRFMLALSGGNRR